MSNKIYVGDVGTTILVDMGEDISSATNLALEVKKPDGSIVEWVPTVSDKNFLKYIIKAGDLTLEGTYTINPKLTLGDWSGRGDTTLFVVSGQFT